MPEATENPGAKSVLNVEALTYERTGPGADEFGNKRSPYKKDRLNRPLAPVEVEIWLKKKDNSKVFQPEAVAPAASTGDSPTRMRTSRPSTRRPPPSRA